jgi:hypothetical protein
MMESQGSFYESIYKSEIEKTYDNIEEIELRRSSRNYFKED